MGIEHIIKDIDASEMNVGYSPLIPVGLEYLNFFGGAAPIGRNLAPGKPPATVVGAPPVGSMSEGILTTYLTNYVQTAVAHTAKMTIVAVAKPLAEGENFLVSNYSGTVINQFLRLRTPSANAGQGKLQIDAASSYRTASGQNIIYGHSGPVDNDVGAAISVAQRLDVTPGGGRVTVNGLTKGYQGMTSGSVPADATPNLGSPLRIGSGYSQFSPNAAPRILFVGIWSRVLSDEELAAQYRQLKDFYGNIKGVAV